MAYNSFANFIITRKSEQPKAEKSFIEKLQKLCGSTNTPLTLLQTRMQNSEINYKANCIGLQVIEEMRYIIKKYSN